MRIVDEFKEMQKSGNKKCARKIAVFYQIFGFAVDCAVKVLKNFGANAVFSHGQKSFCDVYLDSRVIVHDVNVTNVHILSKTNIKTLSYKRVSDRS